MAAQFTWLYSPFFTICVMVYFAAFGFINIRYASKSRNDPEKKDRPELFKNEILVGVLFLVMIPIYPFLFTFTVEDPYIRAQIYFHIWDSLTVQMIIWQFMFPIWKRNNIRKNRVMSFEDWKIKFRETYNARDNRHADFKRKLNHLLTASVFIGLYYLGIILTPYISVYGWSDVNFAVFFQVSCGFHALWTMNIADHLRLEKFEKLGQFARGWAEDAIKPSELNTLTSANVMILAWIPFAMLPPAFLFSVALIGAIADAAASMVGKNFGKIRSKTSKKTLEGYIAGCVSTYLIVLLVHLIMPFPNATPLLVHTMALGAAFGFLLVDVFTKEISDNFSNPLVTGLILILIYFIFV